MAIPKIQGDVNKFIRHHDLYLNFVTQQTSQGEAIEADGEGTLLTRGIRRFGQAHNRFQLYNENGEVYVGPYLTSQDLQRTLAQFMANGVGKPASRWDAELGVLVFLIHELNQQGFVVTGGVQETQHIWQSTNDRWVAHEVLEANGEDWLAKMPAQTDFLRPSDLPKVLLTTTGDYYAVRDQHGSVVIDNVPLQKLVSVLLGLRIGIPAWALTSLLLVPRVSTESFADSQLVITRNQCSAPLEIQTLADFDAVAALPILHDHQHQTYQYQFDTPHEQLGDPMTASVFCGMTSFIYHGMPLRDLTADENLTAWLANLAFSAGMRISLRQQRQVHQARVEALIVTDGIINKLQLKENDEQRGEIETVYDVYAGDADDPIMYDLEFDELVTALLVVGQMQGILKFPN